MNILMIDTSGAACGAAVLSGDRLLCDIQLTGGRMSTRRVLPLAEQALEAAGLRVQDVDVFGAVVGPGSFTGVRIGVSTVKALAYAADKPCIGVNALEALAANVTGFDGVLCPMLDARAQQVYAAVLEAGMPPRRLSEDMAVALDDFLDQVAALGRPAMFLGDGAAAFEKEIRARLGERASLAPVQHRGLRAASACALAGCLAADPARLSDCMTLLPLYLRAPQAERERAARLAGAGEGVQAHG